MAHKFEVAVVEKNVKNPTVVVEDDRTGTSVETLKRAIADNLFYIQGKFPDVATRNDQYMALAYTVRDRLVHRWLTTTKQFIKNDVRAVCYLSAEFLLGPHLVNNLVNMGILENVKKAVEALNIDFEMLVNQEEEPGLGNGGLGRLAACYMDSLATLNIPAIGYGIRYEFGIFEQVIKDGWQVEITDKWLHFGNPWEIPRPEHTMEVQLGGHTEGNLDPDGRYRVRWIPARVINGVPYDTPISGYRTTNTNTLRLWKAEAPESFNFKAFNTGDYTGSVQEKMFSENISKVLYPNDEPIQGRQLRLEQQYFFTSCSLQDMIRIHFANGQKLETFHEKFAVQLNDTHPSVGIAELMRLLIDVYAMEWDDAWEITHKTFGYTNHTLMPEALEKWEYDLFATVLPRHMEIILEINRRFLDEVREKFPNDEARLKRMSIIDEAGRKFIRMAHLASIGSHAINGVAELHSQLVTVDVLKDFYELWPEKFGNVTNGVTPRRWMVVSNPELSSLISETIGEDWVTDLTQLKRLEPFANDPAFRKKWAEIKHQNKLHLATYIKMHSGVTVDSHSIFDVQVKRMHEYKRQLLNVLYVITLYLQIKDGHAKDVSPRTFIFGGKAAPGYAMAKLSIKLINGVADVINNDPDIKNKIKVVFLADYCVKLGQQVYPAADLSEQISTAGKEASGTGNMKFAMNGALTIGTLDGANIEIREEVGADNFFLFGLTDPEVKELKANNYRPLDYYESNEMLRRVIDKIGDGTFSEGSRQVFAPIVDTLLNRDEWMLLADYQAFVDAQARVNEAYKHKDEWTRMSILNVARMGKFSSDRAIREYCENIWNVKPLKVVLEDIDPVAAVCAIY
ncbi:MAG: glycogen/starch/alpha-glucan phosphorylase [Cyanobacteria bacterium SZAS LIN-5]|nr:glycogen/starch/alpha-glucan phosphorylase [Cyanobacteria bacterium SZAS LIN-5]